MAGQNLVSPGEVNFYRKTCGRLIIDLISTKSNGVERTEVESALSGSHPDVLPVALPPHKV